MYFKPNNDCFAFYSRFDSKLFLESFMEVLRVFFRKDGGFESTFHFKEDMRKITRITVTSPHGTHSLSRPQRLSSTTCGGH